MYLLWHSSTSLVLLVRRKHLKPYLLHLPYSACAVHTAPDVIEDTPEAAEEQSGQ